MKIFKNTATLDGYDKGLIFTSDKSEADVVLMGSKPIILDEYINLKGIFRAGVGRDNVPLDEAESRDILVCFPSQDTVNLIYRETARFTCHLILRMMYHDIGSIDPWKKNNRIQLSSKKLLVVGCGNIGTRVAIKMEHFMDVKMYDTLNDSNDDLLRMLQEVDCVTLHIPNSHENYKFFEHEKLALMKDGAVLINTARAPIVSEDALYEEILNGRLRAAFDVFWQEPYDGKLKLYHPNKFYMTPHVASTSSGFLKGCRTDLDKLIMEIKNA
jgi:phosphoglycerate dehydrogenase-like enzyme